MAFIPDPAGIQYTCVRYMGTAIDAVIPLTFRTPSGCLRPRIGSMSINSPTFSVNSPPFAQSGHRRTQRWGFEHKAPIVCGASALVVPLRYDRDDNPLRKSRNRAITMSYESRKPE